MTCKIFLFHFKLKICCPSRIKVNTVGENIITNTKIQNNYDAIAIVGRAITTIEYMRAIKKEAKNCAKKDAKRIKRENFTRSNRGKSHIAIAILKKIMIGWQHNFFVFSW